MTRCVCLLSSCPQQSLREEEEAHLCLESLLCSQCPPKPELGSFSLEVGRSVGKTDLKRDGGLGAAGVPFVLATAGGWAVGSQVENADIFP